MNATKSSLAFDELKVDEGVGSTTSYQPELHLHVKGQGSSFLSYETAPNEVVFITGRITISF